MIDLHFKMHFELSNMRTQITLIFCLLFFCGCSVVMEASRPDPVDISQFIIGESRVQVISQIGAPEATVKDGDLSCDVYKLYTRGPGALGKGAIATTEAVADVFTFGLAEVVTTPVEGATSNKKHTVMFCYDKDDKLVRTKESD